jgi:hypothetical protein
MPRSASIPLLLCTGEPTFIALYSRCRLFIFDLVSSSSVIRPSIRLTSKFSASPSAAGLSESRSRLMGDSWSVISSKSASTGRPVWTSSKSGEGKPSGPSSGMRLARSSVDEPRRRAIGGTSGVLGISSRRSGS